MNQLRNTLSRRSPAAFKTTRLGTAHLGLGLILAAIAKSISAAETLPIAYPVGESPLAAQLSGIDPEWNFSFKAGGKVRVIAATDLAYWGRYRDVESGPQILLTDGGIIRTDVLLMDETQVVLGDASGLARGMWDESSLPRGAVRAIILQPPAARFRRDRLLRDLRSSAASEDRLLLVGGESIGGALVAAPRLGRFAPTEPENQREIFQLARRAATDPLVVPAAHVIAISLGSAQARAKDLTAGAWLGVADGSLVCARSTRTKGNVLSLALVAGGELKTSLSGRDDPDKRFWDSVVYAEPPGARLRWLSDLPGASYKQIPFLSVERALGIDESVVGTRLRTGQAVFRKGIGMPSASRVAYDVSGCRQFQAELAIDQAAGLSGSVVFKVLVEGVGGQWSVAYQSPILRGDDPPLPITVDLKGSARMALLVDFADRGDECDYANWLHARLLK